MKKVYSVIVVILFSAFIFSSNINAQEINAAKDEAIAKKAFAIIPSSLDSDIPGIVESTIYNAIVVKKYYSSADYRRIIDKLNRIAEENPDPSIRAKAHLASIYLSSSDIIDITPKHHTFDHEYIYRQITEQLDNKLLVSK